jgi:hypothetical protein
MTREGSQQGPTKGNGFKRGNGGDKTGGGGGGGAGGGRPPGGGEKTPHKALKASGGRPDGHKGGGGAGGGPGSERKKECNCCRGNKQDCHCTRSDPSIKFCNKCSREKIITIDDPEKYVLKRIPDDVFIEIAPSLNLDDNDDEDTRGGSQFQKFLVSRLLSTPCMFPAIELSKIDALFTLIRTKGQYDRLDLSSKEEEINKVCVYLRLFGLYYSFAFILYC